MGLHALQRIEPEPVPQLAPRHAGSRTRTSVCRILKQRVLKELIEVSLYDVCQRQFHSLDTVVLWATMNAAALHI